MIVTPVGDRLRFVTQPDHAHLAARLMTLWREPAMAEHVRRKDLLAAIREHDSGWRDLDAAPRVDPATGCPWTFLDLPDELRLDVWTRGTRRFVDEHPYVALLTTAHALALHERRRESTTWAAALDEWSEQRDRLAEACGLDLAEVAADYRWLDLADLLSLVVCTDGAWSLDRPDRTLQWQPGVLSIDPFPLAGATTFTLPCRFLDRQTFDGDADLAVALATARWEEVSVGVRPIERA